MIPGVGDKGPLVVRPRCLLAPANTECGEELRWGDNLGGLIRFLFVCPFKASLFSIDKDGDGADDALAGDVEDNCLGLLDVFARTGVDMVFLSGATMAFGFSNTLFSLTCLLLS